MKSIKLLNLFLVSAVIVLFMASGQNNDNPGDSIFQVEDTMIKTTEDLIKYAEPLLINKYGKKQIKGERPYKISIKDGVWQMSGTLPKGYKGGTFFTRINAKDGKILIMTHYK